MHGFDAILATVGLSVDARIALADLLSERGSGVGARRAELTDAGWSGRDGVLDPRRAFLLGVDVGGTKAQSVLCDLNGGVLAEVRTPTAAGGGLAVVEQLGAQRDAMLADSGLDGGRLVAAGIGLPASVDPVTGRLHRAPNVADLEGLDLRALLGERLGLPVAVENDVNMAALGEHWLGEGRDDRSLVFIALGTGIGMGIVLGGELLCGSSGAAGEIAWLPIGADPFDRRTFRSGTLESAISSGALVRSYTERGGMGAGTLRDLFDREDDSAFDAVLDHLAGFLAQAILSVCAILDPGRVVLGGSVGSRKELLDRLRIRLDCCMSAPPECRISSLGNRAGVLGAVRAARLQFARSLM